MSVLLFLILLFLGSMIPKEGNYKVMTVLSGSMEPSIKIGSTVVIAPWTNYKEGDIITFYDSSRKDVPVTHRIKDIKVKNGELFYKTKGDANDTVDLKDVKQEKIIGEVIFHIPYLGYFIEFVKKPIGFIVIIIIPALLVVFEEVKKIHKELKRNK